MLAETMVAQLNEQINLEFFSSNLYLQMSAWCEDKGFEGAAEFLRAHAQEEMEHMQKLFTYVSETGALPILGTIEAPQHEFETLGEVFRETEDGLRLLFLAAASASCCCFSESTVMVWLSSHG